MRIASAANPTDATRILGGVDRRYQAFVSSTYADLTEERAEVVSMLLNLDALPAGMELFPATNDDAWTLIKRVIDESDYYLLVIGGRYGSVDDETQLSYTEKEFDYAVARKKPVMAFLHGDPGKIAAEKTDQNDEARDKLNAFRKKVEGVVHVNYWKEPSELAGLVAKSFMKIQKSHPAIGWIRGDVQTATESLEELNVLRKRLDEAERQLVAAREGPPPGTEDFAQASDEISVLVHAQATVRRGYDRYTPSFAVEVEVSWDAILAEIGPLMLDEARQAAIEHRLDRWYLAHAYNPAMDRLEAWLTVNKLGRQDDDDVDAGAISNHDFDTMLLQLRALGLITKSERNRSVKDTATYWALTPYGDARLTSLRAIRKGGSLADVPEDSEAKSE